MDWWTQDLSGVSETLIQPTTLGTRAWTTRPAWGLLT